jgi:hypothetical protein
MTKKKVEVKDKAVEAEVEQIDPSVLVLDVRTLDELLMKNEAVLMEESLDDNGRLLWTVARVGDMVNEYCTGDLIYKLFSEQSPSPFRALDKSLILTDKYNIKLGVRKAK